MSIYINLISIFWSFFISVFAIPSIIYVAHAKKLLDVPNGRTVHESLTPRLGGLAIFAGFLSSVTIFGIMSSGVRELIAGSILLFFIGLKDDIVTVSAFKKFFVQVLATGIVMFIGDVRIESFNGLFGINELDPGISYLFTFLVIIGVTNAINLVDGVDGLAGSIVLLICVFFGSIFFLWGGENFAPFSTVAFCLAGAMCGFLRYNLHKAIIFMGDTGSLVAGFIVAVLGVKFVELNPVSYSPVLAIAILFIPVLDTLRVFALRIVKGVSPFTPDKNHLHHRLVDLGFNQMTTVICLVFINLGAVILVWVFRLHDINIMIFILITYALALISIIEFIHIKKTGKNFR
jgi:UDP-GlcNAc:undecaprenyl-phosphate/decaprenyl-phosphate GlcNAc-1-phosphate transferase